ncbi:MAG: universal stress protein [Desulfovibrio sp.]|uniref:universal stress protein n=1 Tax=Desulfovibrio sp. 7SRBS1 TaxID=3378064 RepID=UPI003B3C38D8
MEKHLLLAISDEISASYSLRFVKGMIGDFHSTRLTLLYIAPRAQHWNLGTQEMHPPPKVADEITGIKNSRGGQALHQAKQWLVDYAGCVPDMVESKIITSRKGTVLEIIDEARSGLYDAVVLGRRGYSWFEGLFENSVAHSILWEAIDFPLWICRRQPLEPNRNVLLCIDGSDAGTRMADHVGFMLGEQDRHKVTIFHVAEKKQPFGDKVDEIFNRADKILKENGLPEELIEFKAVRSGNIAKAVVAEQTQGQYAAIALGKRDDAPARMENIFPSSLCIRLLRMVENTALWIGK